MKLALVINQSVSRMVLPRLIGSCKSDDLLKRDFKSDKPLEKCVTNITEIKAKDGKLYVSAIFDCFDSSVLGLAMETNMKATLCEHTLNNAYLAYPDLARGSIPKFV